MKIFKNVAWQKLYNRFFVAIKFAFKNILLVPVRIVMFIVNKIGDTFKFSLTFKIGLIYTILVMVVLIVFNLSLVGGFKYTIMNTETRQIEQVKQALVAMLSQSDTVDIDLLEQLAINEGVEVNLYDASIVKKHTTNQTLPSLKYNIKSGKATSVKDLGSVFLVSTKSLKMREGLYYIQIVKNITDSFSNLNKLSYISALLTLVLSAAVVIIGARISRNLLTPITKMTDQIKRITVKSLDTRLDVTDAQDELKDLTQQFNSMLDNIEEAYRKQNQFVSDASHELRTPISVINGYTSMLDRWGKKDEAILEEAIVAIKDETLQMQSLIEKLLFLARSDRNKIEMEIDNIDLEALACDICKETEMIDNKHIIKCDVKGTSKIQGNEKMIKQMMRIFIENAVKFTEEGGEITIGMLAEAEKTLLYVKDSGVGIPKEDLPRIFDRFYQADKARNKKRGGAGLGLSIAKWIIDQHGALVKIYSQEGVGTKIEVRFNKRIKLVNDSLYN